MSSAAESSSAIRLVPLGGLGEIGMNCLALEQDGRILVVDCGAAFPHDDLGVDLIHPDLRWLFDRADDVAGVFVTHGHEDHVGGVPFLLRELDVPVFGSPHALAVVRRRLEEHEVDLDDVELLPIRAGETYRVGPFRVEPIRVSHSVVEAMALAIETAAGMVIHTGDFNLDLDPLNGAATDEARLGELGTAGVELLLSDSTNIDVLSRPGSERGVARRLEELVVAAEQRVIVAMFASNVQRLRTIGEIAQRAGRKLCLLGRSLVQQAEIATAMGHLTWSSDLRIAPEQAAEVPRSELIVLAGGSQAEPASAVARLARGVHPHLAVEPGDTVVFSSRVIPGHELAVHELVCALLRLGARVHDRHTDPDVHTSGHAGQSEQRRMIELVRPRCFAPVHGTLRHLMRHADLARACGVPQVLVVEDGTVLRLDSSGLTRDGTVTHGEVHVAIGGEVLDVETLARREELARGGVAVVALVIDGERRLRSGPTLRASGVPAIDASAERAVTKDVVRALERHRKLGPRDPRLVEELRRAARRALLAACGYRPPVEILLQVVEG